MDSPEVCYQHQLKKKRECELVTHYEINPAHSFWGKNLLRMMIREMKTEKVSKEDSSKLFIS